MDTIAEAMWANDGKITHEPILEWIFGQIVEPGPRMMMGMVRDPDRATFLTLLKLSDNLPNGNRPKE
jgi:hypothetical protein